MTKRYTQIDNNTIVGIKMYQGLKKGGTLEPVPGVELTSKEVYSLTYPNA